MTVSRVIAEIIGLNQSSPYSKRVSRRNLFRITISRWNKLIKTRGYPLKPMFSLKIMKQNVSIIRGTTQSILNILRSD